MRSNLFDIHPYLNLDEGQFFDRKSLFEGPEGAKRPRERREVRDQVAEYVAAFANAEGGVLILGIADDGTLQGHRLPADALATLLSVPQSRLLPPQEPGFIVEHDGHSLVVFDVSASDVPVQVVGDGYPLRMGDKTVQSSESKIQALKFRGMAESYESMVTTLLPDELDEPLVRRAVDGAGYKDLGLQDYLLRRKLAERRGSRIVLRRAAEILFAVNGPEHPNCSVRVFRVVGTERRTGANHNVEELPRIEGNLVQVLEQTTVLLRQLIRRPSRLVGSRFQRVSEYPEFCWLEAVLNAVAHRDYGLQTQAIEVWLYDDRMQVLSPGGLLPEVSLDALVDGTPLHASRNPRLVRVLVDLGFMRDQGEGIPRIHEQMAAQFLPAPELSVVANRFSLTLRNTPTLTEQDEDFFRSLGGIDIDGDELRALLEAYRHGRVDNATMRRIGGKDTLQASGLLRRLRDRGLLELHGAGSASYYSLAPPDRREVDADRGEFDLDRRELAMDRMELGADRGEFDADRGELGADRGELDADRGELGADRGEPGADRGEFAGSRNDLPVELQHQLSSLGRRPRAERLRPVIQRLCAWRGMNAKVLAELLAMSTRNLVERHLSPMVDAGMLQLAYPEHRTHPSQAYLIRHTQLQLLIPELSRPTENDSE